MQINQFPKPTNVIEKTATFSTPQKCLLKPEQRHWLTPSRAGYCHEHVSNVRGVIHRQTNRQHKEHGGDDVDCQTPEMYGPHDVNLLMDNKLTEATLKVHLC